MTGNNGNVKETNAAKPNSSVHLPQRPQTTVQTVAGASVNGIPFYSVNNTKNNQYQTTNANNNFKWMNTFMTNAQREQIEGVIKSKKQNEKHLKKLLKQINGVEHKLKNKSGNQNLVTQKQNLRKRKNELKEKIATTNSTYYNTKKALNRATGIQHKYTFPNININKTNTNNGFSVEMESYNYITVNAAKFTKVNTLAVGTASLDKDLTNIYWVETKGKGNVKNRPLLSIRYGTPTTALQNEQRLTDIVNFAKTTNLNTNNPKRRVIVLSLLDSCPGRVCTDVITKAASGDINKIKQIAKKKASLEQKRNESVISGQEKNTYNKGDDVQFIRLSCSAAITEMHGMMKGGSNNYSTLTKWLNSTNKNVIKISSFFTTLQTKHGMFGNTSHTDPTKRFKEFVALSIIRYFLHLHDQQHSYVYMYHCKSGKDRTGLIYALDQTVLYCCTRISNTDPMMIFNKLTNGLDGVNLPRSPTTNSGQSERPQQLPNNQRSSTNSGRSSTSSGFNGYKSLNNFNKSPNSQKSGKWGSVKNKVRLLARSSVNSSGRLSVNKSVKLQNNQQPNIQKKRSSWGVVKGMLGSNPKGLKWAEIIIPISNTNKNPLKLGPILNIFLKRAYLITYASTGFPGLKWNCVKKDGKIKIKNPIADLLDRPENVARWCGASGLTGA